MKLRIAREWLIFLVCLVIGLFATYFAVIYLPRVPLYENGEKWRSFSIFITI